MSSVGNLLKSNFVATEYKSPLELQILDGADGPIGDNNFEFERELK